MNYEERLARRGYEAYGRTTDFKNYQGLPMPAFEDLPEKIRAAWIAASEEIATAHELVAEALTADEYQGEIHELEAQAPNGMTFGSALEALKDGKHVARRGWNGKGMWLALMRGLSVPARLVNNRTRAHGITGDLHLCAYIVIVNAFGEWQPGWLASQADMLADDWTLVP